jgi:hypothetical protein
MMTQREQTIADRVELLAIWACQWAAAALLTGLMYEAMYWASQN